MYKRHIEVAKSYCFNSETGEYFYHLKTRWTVCGEVMIQDEWVPVTKEIFDFLRRSDWASDKKQSRASRCLKEDGTRCKEDCRECVRSRSGLSLSLDQLVEDGLLPENGSSIEENVEHQELITALHKAIDDFGGKDQEIITMWASGFSEREIARHIGMSQRGVGYRRKKLVKELAEALKDFC